MCVGVYILLLEDYECVTQHLFTEPTLFAQQRTDVWLWECRVTFGLP